MGLRRGGRGGPRKTRKDKRKVKTMEKETGLVRSFINWITGTGRTVRRTTTFLGKPKVVVTDYDRGYRTVRIRKQGFFGNRNSYKRERLDGRWQGEFKGKRGFWTGQYSGDYTGVCFRCNGTGFSKGHTCRRCGGTGQWHKHHGR